MPMLIAMAAPFIPRPSLARRPRVLMELIGIQHAAQGHEPAFA
jgi:hypothetical protein